MGFARRAAYPSKTACARSTTASWRRFPSRSQLGLFLLRLDRPLALERLAAVTAGRAKVAA
jgi:hypothetical protein